MLNNKKIIAFGLMLPILSLIGLTAYRQFTLETGTEVILPISAYDPRDLLAGKYLTYKIDYGVSDICAIYSRQPQEAYICLENKYFSYSKPEGCKIYIKGVCSQHQFKAGIERYYISEKYSRKFEQQLRTENASVVLSVTPNGRALVKDVLINDQSIRNQ